MSREEIERLFAAASHLKQRVLLMTTYAAGLRVSEVCALKVTDIDSERMTIRVRAGQGGEGSIHAALAASVEGAAPVTGRRIGQSHGCFRRRASADRPFNPHAAQRMFYAARDKAQITKRCGIHGLRHAFATHLLEAGTDVHTIQRLMGHTDIHTTMRYFHLARQKIGGRQTRRWSC